MYAPATSLHADRQHHITYPCWLLRHATTRHTNTHVLCARTLAVEARSKAAKAGAGMSMVAQTMDSELEDCAKAAVAKLKGQKASFQPLLSCRATQCSGSAV
jgi:hypothetical protein